MLSKAVQVTLIIRPAMYNILIICMKFLDFSLHTLNRESIIKCITNDDKFILFLFEFRFFTGANIRLKILSRNFYLRIFSTFFSFAFFSFIIKCAIQSVYVFSSFVLTWEVSFLSFKSFRNLFYSVESSFSLKEEENFGRSLLLAYPSLAPLRCLCVHVAHKCMQCCWQTHTQSRR